MNHFIDGNIELPDKVGYWNHKFILIKYIICFTFGTQY